MLAMMTSIINAQGVPSSQHEHVHTAGMQTVAEVQEEWGKEVHALLVIHTQSYPLVCVCVWPYRSLAPSLAQALAGV
jgi:hypothetical protein